MFMTHVQRLWNGLNGCWRLWSAVCFRIAKPTIIHNLLSGISIPPGPSVSQAYFKSSTRCAELSDFARIALAVTCRSGIRRHLKGILSYGHKTLLEKMHGRTFASAGHDKLSLRILRMSVISHPTETEVSRNNMPCLVAECWILWSHAGHALRKCMQIIATTLPDDDIKEHFHCGFEHILNMLKQWKMWKSADKPGPQSRRLSPIISLNIRNHRSELKDMNNYDKHALSRCFRWCDAFLAGLGEYVPDIGQKWRWRALCGESQRVVTKSWVDGAKTPSIFHANYCTCAWWFVVNLF